MFLIGLTGGIASGKSVVGRRLAERGAVHVDADVLARQVVEVGTPALAAIERAFGPSVISTDGRLNRLALGALVFSDPKALEVLNGITHPAVRARSRQLFAAAEIANPTAVVVYDVPLLAETAAVRPLGFDLIAVVHADPERRISRMIELRGLSRKEAIDRLTSQAGDAERLAIADVVIDANGTLEETLAQADQLWTKAKASADSKHRS